MTELLASRPPATAWSGPAAQASFTRTSEAVGALGEIANRLVVTAHALARLADLMQASLELVRHAERRAAEGGGQVDGLGQLILPRLVVLDPVLAAHLVRQESLLREEVFRDVRQAESLARQADDEAAGRLVAAVRGPADALPPAPAKLPVPAPPSLPDNGFIHPDSVFANASWWRSLTPEEKGRAIRDHPQWVGPRDGLPAWARHQANLELLARAERNVAARLAAARRNPFHLLPEPWEDEVERAERYAQALRTVRDVVSRQDGVPRQLLAIGGADGLVTAVVAVGDVDRADHVATFVGGFTTTVKGDLRPLDSELVGMRHEATAVAQDGAEVAVVAWLGYPAPQISGLSQWRRSVATDSIARDRADELAAFLTGLDAARDTPLHSTLWAHSYGSAVAGNALLLPGDIDDVVLFGSPGVPIRKLESTGLKPGGLNVLDAPTDVVPLLAPAFPGVSALRVPGARRLATMHVNGMPERLRTSFGHSQYTAPGTLSRHNLIAVAAGRPDLVIPASEQEVQFRAFLLRTGLAVARPFLP
ncbi:MAG: alpha/beta hydrolase family protein [Intrasporangium sp.]|uniref:alpha/beta hydrolase n=1 Tax=Intrasporangium sp. TaxID=1925024 RepID=UPI002648CF7C|nr:alpha/beta hydrolase [Intrasporangium sp.]MDN5794958.1 alpha/beta hydrolase family protein [Intrasporangium sp.]